jgi:hypothetical protein
LLLVRRVNNARKKDLLALLTLALVAVGAACDPPAPGAAGTISLDATIDATMFSTLAIRAFPNPSGSFDPTLPIPSGVAPVDEHLAGLVFPHHYRIGGGIGGTKVPDWRLVAWLSRRTEEAANHPEATDVYCSVTFKIASESGYYGGVTEGVDCTIGDVVPPTPAP